LAEQPNYFASVEKSSTVPATKRFPVFFDGRLTHFALGELFNGEGGKTVYVASAWQNERGIIGQWSEFKSAVVP